MSHFIQLAENKLYFKTISDLKDLEERLADIIQNLINTDLDRLMSAFYKIDISEQIFRNIISKAPTEQISILLAQEVIKRELQKIESRRKYKDYFK